MRIFISHSSSNNLEARAVKKWLTDKGEIPGEEIFLDIDPDSGIPTGKRWKEELRRAASRCEAVICLLSREWEASKHCNVEYLYSEDLRKTIIVGRIADMEATSITSEWQRCDLFVGDGPGEDIRLASGETVTLSAVGLQRMLAGIRSLGIGVEHFQWPPTEDPGRAPYRGWAALDRYDAAVYFGRDAEIVRGLDVLRGMRTSGIESMLVIQGPSGAGKSAFLRAGLLPRLYRDDRRFLPMGVVRPALNALSGDTGLGAAIFAVRKDLGLTTPGRGEIKKACRPDNVDQLRGWLQEARDAQYERVKDETTAVPPTLVLPLDQAEELFANDVKGEAAQFLQIAADLMEGRDGVTPAVIMVATIRSDSYEPLQTAPQLTGIGSKSFNDLKAMSSANFAEVITGPAKRIEREGQRLEIDARLVKKLTEEYGTPDALPLLALTLSRLYAEYHDDGDLTLEEYKLMGGLKEVVQREVDLILGVGRTRKSNLKILRKAFIPRLATVDPDNGNPRRNLAKWSELPSDSHRLIEAFIKSRLLVVRTPQDDKEAIEEDDDDVVVDDDAIVDNDPVVEVALESLMRNWAELAEWLSVEGEDLKLAERITRAAREWDTNRQDDEYLDLRGTRLEDAERIATKKGFNHGDWWNLSRQFLKRCREREESLAAERDQAAAEKEESQAAEIQLLREKKESAEAYAADIADRESKLKESERRVRRWLFGTVAAALATVVAVVFVALFAHTADVATERADDTQLRADKQFREATALRLVNETEAVLYRRSPDGDFRALQQAVAAPQIDEFVDQSALLDMVVSRRDLLKVVNTGPPVTAVAAGANGTLLATSDANGVLRVWKAGSAEQIGGDIDTGHGTVWTVAFIGNSIVTGSNDGTVLRWDLDSKQPTALMVSTEGPAVRSVSVSSDDRTIAAASVDGTVRVWNANDNAPSRPHIRTNGDALAVAVHGDMIATGSKTGMVELWNLRARDRRPVELPVGGGEVWSVAFSPNGDQLAVAGQNRDVTLWDTADGTKSDVKFPHRGGVWSVAYNAKGDRLVTGGTDDVARVWNATTGESIVTDESDNGLVGDNGDVKSAVFAGVDVATASDDGTFRLWRPEPIVESGTESGSPVTSLAFVGDSTFAVDQAGRVRSILGGTDQIKQLESGPAAAPAVGSDGSTLTVASPGGSIQTWNLADRTSIGPEINTGKGDVTALAVGGGQIASRSGNATSIRLWDLRTGALSDVAVAVGDEPIGVTALSPDGTKLAAAIGSGKVRVWDTASGAVVVDAIAADPHYGERTVNDIAFSPDSARIVTAARGDDSVREFDAATGKELGLMYGHHRDVASVAYSHSGRYIASGDDDGEVRIWDTRTHRPVGLPITTDSRRVTRIAFGPGDERLAVGVADGAVRLLPGPAAWSRELCSKLTHNMSETEWEDWVTPDIDDIEACEGLLRRPKSR